ncbi:MAG: sodium:calcium symporter [Planctomycetes bacterium]|nr:sodium:calcium symporter [Planctomycetota bacterium]
MIPLIIFMYYVVIEAWTLGYTVRFLRAMFDPALRFADVAASEAYFASFVGIAADGAALKPGLDSLLPWLVIVFLLNLVLIYRGISQGIELACRVGMPVLVVLSLLVLVRVLTLGTPDPARPDHNVSTGLGYMWNPGKTLVVAADGKTLAEVVDADPLRQRTRAETLAAATEGATVVERTVLQQLADPNLWLAAAGQIFFSLSVGFGVILVYASYMGPRDDLLLSGLTASATNEFCEVALGGLITLPAAVAFLGVAGVAGKGTFGLGFNVLPMVFSTMPLGSLFGALFFFVLFIAAITSSLSMLQPGIALLEESLGITRKGSVGLLGTLTALGTGFVAWFSKDLKALDTLDFWVGTFLIFVLATVQIILFGWFFGIERGWRELHAGAALNLPGWFKPVFRYVCPAFLIAIFALWVARNVFGWDPSGGGTQGSPYTKALFVDGDPVAWLCIGVVTVVAAGLAATIGGSRRYRDETE